MMNPVVRLLFWAAFLLFPRALFYGPSSSPSYLSMASSCSSMDGTTTRNEQNNDDKDKDNKEMMIESNTKLETWEKKWEAGTTNWHISDVNVAFTHLGHFVNLARYDDDQEDAAAAAAAAESSSCSSSPSQQQQKEEKEQQAAAAVANKGSLRVLVPLCGKTVDMAFLATHPNVSLVVGVDGVAKPLESFQQEHGHLNIQEEQEQQTTNNDDDDDVVLFRKWKGEGIELYQGNFFDFSPLMTKEEETFFDVIYDRGSLVAINPALRPKYMSVIAKAIRPKTGKVMLAVVERVGTTTTTTTPQSSDSPPFHFSEQDVRDLYLSQPWVASVTPLEYNGEPLPSDDPSKWISKYYLIQAK